jgi:hypothetical protein
MSTVSGPGGQGCGRDSSRGRRVAAASEGKTDYPEWAGRGPALRGNLFSVLSAHEATLPTGGHGRMPGAKSGR